MSFSYDQAADAASGDEVTWALRDVTLSAPAGETLALVGETGAGKSTIAKLVARFYDPQRGRVSVDGHDLRDVTQASLRRQLGVVPQEGFLFGGTVRENIEFGRPGAGELEIIAATKAVGAHDFIRRLEDGYETDVGERGSRLSAGQRQLIALARAFIADPRILVLDEATANVDVHAEVAIEHGLRTFLRFAKRRRGCPYRWRVGRSFFARRPNAGDADARGRRILRHAACEPVATHHFRGAVRGDERVPGGTVFSISRPRRAVNWQPGSAAAQ